MSHAGLGLAQTPAVANPQVEVEYLEPKASSGATSEFADIYLWLRTRRPLHEMQQFLAPLRLPQKLKIQVDQCGADRRPYVPGGPVTICYELISKIQKIANRFREQDRQGIVTGTFVQVALHEVTYGIFDQLQVPVWGREEDAADKLAAFILMQFGDDIARTAITGTIDFFKESLRADPKRVWTGSAFADIASPEPQRFYNFLCIAYGKDPIGFDWLVEPGTNRDPLLPWSRAGLWTIRDADDLDPTTKEPRRKVMRSYNCQREYEQVRNAFNLRIMPFVDPDLLLKIKAQAWFMPSELPK
jgi:hypothetical protein